MSNPNFVSELVLMAKAMEELPVVQAELSTARQTIDTQQATIQRLELKLLDRANEIDTLNAAVRKAEVERDHAEHMFLETDDRLNAFRRLLSGFQAEAAALDKASEPQPPKEVPADPSVSTEHYAPVPGTEYGEPKAEPAVMSEDHIDGPFPYSRGESAVDPTSANSTASPSPSADTPAPSTENVGTSSSEAPSTLASDAGVSVSDYPTSATSPSAGSASPADTAPTQADANADDVGYHNEPEIGDTGVVADDWADWELWQRRMDARYGVHRWPRRDLPQASRASQYSF